jgi:hypothetical protein
MRMSNRSKFAIRAALLLGGCASGLYFGGCSSGGGGGTSLQLETVSVANNAIWQLNRPIFFVFSTDIDFSSVNMNTIHIGQASGAPATGAFTLVDPRTVKFQPRCPTLPDNSDAGLLPGGIRYVIQVPGAGSGGATVRSASGGSLTNSLTIQFNTVNSDDPALLFIDTAIGPPTPVIRTDPSVTDATYLEIGDDPTNRVYFEPRASPDPVLGAETPAGFTAGLNLYSDGSTHVSMLLAINQAVDAADSNVNSSNVRLEYQSGSGAWLSLAHTVDLEQNCLGTGALVRVTPTGILPQNHLVRVVLTQDFQDIVGDSNLVAITVGSFLVTTATDPGTTTPGAASDEIKEEFTVGGSHPGSLEDTTSVLADPRADWGDAGTLRAGFAFGGTGGPGGQFDWTIGNDQPPSQSNHPTVLLDTSFSVILNDDQSQSETVVNGLVDVRNLHVWASGTLLIQGPNPCKILVSGNALIEGEVNLKGNNNLSVATLNTTNQPEPGATGKAGGGRGGTGNYLTSQSTPKGGNGFGAFDASDGGGVGGESAFDPTWSPGNNNDQARRPAGGGGGALGHNFLRPAGIVQAGYTNANQCPDQFFVGYDAEPGFSGYNLARGVITGSTPPVGGAVGPRPFFDADPGNDFWGTMKVGTSQLVPGELSQPWAGAGGGAGGNAIVSNSFPTTPFDPSGDEKGAGGGGGGGSLTILALGNITFGQRGRIIASGGTGGGGENSLSGDITHIGGGSGGGSGGHVILQTASQIDLRTLVSNTQGGNPAGGIYALGGNGGAGKNNVGGATPGGVPTSPTSDALPPNSYPSGSALCGVNGTSNSNNPGYPNGFNNNMNPDGSLVVICCGGDGGPGLIQFHTPTLSDILVPQTQPEVVYSVCRPPPVGSFPATGVPTYSVVNNPLQWNQMLPIFGRRSEAISKWIPLGAASVTSDASSTTPGPVRFIFGGTTAGIITTSGSGDAAVVVELPPALTGTLVTQQQGFPYVDPDERTLVFDGTTIVDPADIYLRNPALMKRFLVHMAHASITADFEVASATYDPVSHALRLTLDASGSPLSNFPIGSTAEIRPRFFRVITNGTPNSLPTSSQVLIEFQATIPNSQGDPDESPANVSAWVTDITQIDPNLGTPPHDYKFFRFRISFDISAQGQPLTFDTPIPSLDFFRIPFRF